MDWQPIETAKRDGSGGVVLLANAEGKVQTAAYRTDSKTGECFWVSAAKGADSILLLLPGYGGVIPDPTHWMPLPKHPDAPEGSRS